MRLRDLNRYFFNGRLAFANQRKTQTRVNGRESNDAAYVGAYG